MNHFMYDGYHANEHSLDDIKTINSVLNEIVSTLNLDAAMPPFLLPYYYAMESDDDGISAFTTLRGGHITIHTFPRRGCLFLDLLYDGYFDEDKLVAILRRVFELQPQYERKLRTERRFFDSTIDSKRIWQGGDSKSDFGPHIIAKIENADVNFERIFDMLDKMPRSINMIPICRPYVLKSTLVKPAYISGIVLIAQSHIAFHYSIEERVLYCDLFSCSFYKSENFISYLKRHFGEFAHMTIIRGSKHEENMDDNELRRTLKYGKWMESISDKR
ncbi:MAG: S-adenosylmethionine decarboxylase [Clostridiales bacterium]|nr:S-adenosylmethionine decarboxylase [Clostridiales bacterium]